jgi:hypothetical protein
MMKRSIGVLLGLVALGAGCASTEMTDTWTAPQAKGAELSKVAVIAMAKDPGLRRMAETTAAQNMVGAQAVPGYQVLGDTDLRDKDAVQAKLKSQGFQAVLLMRVAGVNERVDFTGTPFATFGDYYGYVGDRIYDPGFVQTDTIVHVISTLYSLEDQKLIWSGTSQSFDPASAKSFMNDVSKAVAKSLQKDRVIL